ncbi:PadR family transcriptional regulator [Streptomyces violascens]|uniref:PadR family transcriptional regulator n=1 Tax=Streptomyces violascens TaxID=67381 RepID=UPI00369F7CF7
MTTKSATAVARPPFRMTTPTRLVLTALDQHGQLFGLDIVRVTGLGSGTIYPILARLHAHGWITGDDETGPHPGRPARRYHQLTERGRTGVRGVLNRKGPS